VAQQAFGESQPCLQDALPRVRPQRDHVERERLVEVVRGGEHAAVGCDEDAAAVAHDGEQFEEETSCRAGRRGSGWRERRARLVAEQHEPHVRGKRENSAAKLSAGQSLT
jgi:hypothetical protein